MDVGVIVAADPENEASVFAALATLPDHAAAELQPGELQQKDAPDLVFLRHWFGQRGEEPPTA